MKISVNLVKCLLGGFAGFLTSFGLDYTILTWQYYVIILPAIIVIIKWTDIVYNNYRRKRKTQQ